MRKGDEFAGHFGGHRLAPAKFRRSGKVKRTKSSPSDDDNLQGARIRQKHEQNEH